MIHVRNAQLIQTILFDFQLHLSLECQQKGWTSRIRKCSFIPKIQQIRIFKIKVVLITSTFWVYNIFTAQKTLDKSKINYMEIESSNKIKTNSISPPFPRLLSFHHPTLDPERIASLLTSRAQLSLEPAQICHTFERSNTVNWWHNDIPRFLVVMVFRPTSCNAPAPRISWHVLELNIWWQIQEMFMYQQTENFVSWQIRMIDELAATTKRSAAIITWVKGGDIWEQI